MYLTFIFLCKRFEFNFFAETLNRLGLEPYIFTFCMLTKEIMK